MLAFHILFEFVPVILAIMAIPSLLKSMRYGRRPVPIVLAVVACILLIIAQTGWIQAYLTEAQMAMTLFDKLWTVFNIMVMVVFITWANPFRKGDTSDKC